MNKVVVVMLLICCGYLSGMDTTYLFKSKERFKN